MVPLAREGIHAPVVWAIGTPSGRIATGVFGGADIYGPMTLR
ncbi:MAG: hypothetical protein GHCLOJNM_03744 [bacterium]|nr:hypothetical protein [bacterium]